MSNFFNEAGEPLMDGASMRYEMYLDSLYEPDPDRFYESDNEAPCERDEDLCEGGDLDYVDSHTGECSWCGRLWPFDWDD